MSPRILGKPLEGKGCVGAEAKQDVGVAGGGKGWDSLEGNSWITQDGVEGMGEDGFGEGKWWCWFEGTTSGSGD